MFQVLILLWSVLSLDTLSTLMHLSTVDLSGSGSWVRGTAGAMVAGPLRVRVLARGTAGAGPLRVWVRGTAGAMGAEVAPVSRPARSAGCRATQIYHELWERTFIYTCWRNVE